MPPPVQHPSSPAMLSPSVLCPVCAHCRLLGHSASVNIARAAPNPDHTLSPGFVSLLAVTARFGGQHRPHALPPVRPPLPCDRGASASAGPVMWKVCVRCAWLLPTARLPSSRQVQVQQWPPLPAACPAGVSALCSHCFALSCFKKTAEATDSKIPSYVV